MDHIEGIVKDLVDHIHEGVYFVDRDRRIRYWNLAAERITGFRADEVTGRCCSQNILNHVNSAGTNMCRGHCPLSKTLEDGALREEQVFLHHKDGHRIPVLTRVVPVRDSGERITGAIEIFTQLTSRTAIAERLEALEAMAMYDELTKLANRRYLELDLRQRLGELSRFGWPSGLVFIDLDRFKTINDEYGHHTGDDVLRSVGATLRSNCRPFDVFGRWAGDEFAGVLRNIDETALVEICERLRVLVEGTFIVVDGERVGVTASFGATMLQPGDDVDRAIRRSDELMYSSKTSGTNRVTLG